MVSQIQKMMHPTAERHFQFDPLDDEAFSHSCEKSLSIVNSFFFSCALITDDDCDEFPLLLVFLSLKWTDTSQNRVIFA